MRPIVEDIKTYFKNIIDESLSVEWIYLLAFDPKLFDLAMADLDIPKKFHPNDKN